eukprot:14490501-Heterocapsa_arctica.AAC.1
MLCGDGQAYLTPLAAKLLGETAGAAYASGRTDLLRVENGGGPAKYSAKYSPARVLIRRKRSAGPP